jgi:hypothetical protein
MSLDKTCKTNGCRIRSRSIAGWLSIPNFGVLIRTRSLRNSI